MIRDSHTHDISAADAVISVSPDFTGFRPGAYYSVGIHPWGAADRSDYLLQRLHEAASRSDVVAIGETGIDRRRGPEPSLQQELFLLHARLAEETSKPLIIHCVGAWNEIMQARSDLKPSQPWIIHGFRGKSQLARQLIDNGFYLSLGERFNPETPAVIPPDRLLIETDESKFSPETIAASISPAAYQQAIDNATRIFKH